MEETEIEKAKDETKEEKPKFDMYCRSCWRKLPSDAEFCPHCKEPDPFYYKKTRRINALCICISVLAVIGLFAWGYFSFREINWDDIIIIKNEVLAVIFGIVIGLACFYLAFSIFWYIVTIICLFLEHVFFGFFFRRCERHMKDIFYDKKDSEGFVKWKEESGVAYWS